MDCERARELFQETLDGAPAEPEADAHLAGCAACRSSTDRLRALHEALLAEPVLTWSPARTAEVSLALRRMGRRQRVWSLAAAAALLLAAWLGFAAMPEVPALGAVSQTVAERLPVPDSPGAALGDVTGAVDTALTAVGGALPVPESAALAPAAIVLLLVLNGFALGRPLLARRRKS